MSLPVVLRPEATKDTAEAIGYFDALRPGLGQAFLIQVQDVLLRISGMPEIHGIVWRNVRAARLRRAVHWPKVPLALPKDSPANGTFASIARRMSGS